MVSCRRKEGGELEDSTLVFRLCFVLPLVKRRALSLGQRTEATSRPLPSKHDLPLGFPLLRPILLSPKPHYVWYRRKVAEQRSRVRARSQAGAERKTETAADVADLDDERGVRRKVSERETDRKEKGEKYYLAAEVGKLERAGKRKRGGRRSNAFATRQRAKGRTALTSGPSRHYQNISQPKLANGSTI